jgi:hypothetical protein
VQRQFGLRSLFGLALVPLTIAAALIARRRPARYRLQARLPGLPGVSSPGLAMGEVRAAGALLGAVAAFLF